MNVCVLDAVVVPVFDVGVNPKAEVTLAPVRPESGEEFTILIDFNI